MYSTAWLVKGGKKVRNTQNVHPQGRNKTYYGMHPYCIEVKLNNKIDVYVLISNNLQKTVLLGGGGKKGWRIHTM